MNRITSHYLPRARLLLTAFRSEGSAGAHQKPLDPQKETERQRSPAGWPVTRAQLADELQQRLDGATLPQQRGTAYCGCAAFLYCLLEDRPDWYVAYATALWSGLPFTFASARERQTVGVTPGTRQSLATIQQTRTADPKISSLDWMTMASLSAATRLRHAAEPVTARPTDEARSITWPWMVRRWFASVGAPATLDSVNIGLFNASRQDLLDLLALWSGYWLVLQIDSSLLQGGSTSIRNRHWVVVNPETRPLFQPPGQRGEMSPPDFAAWERSALSTQANAYAAQAALDVDDAALVDLRVVSWGDEHSKVKGATLGNIASRFYGGFAFPRFNR